MSVKKKITAVTEKAVHRVDGWMNFLTGLGTKQDKRMGATVQWFQVDETTAEQLYATDKMAQKVVDMPVEEAMREGYEFVGIDEDKAEALRQVFRILGVDEMIKEGSKLARIYRGAGAVIVSDDMNKLEEPLSDKAQIKGFILLNGYELYANSQDIQLDIRETDFGFPTMYTMQPRQLLSGYSGQKIHASRILRFDGAYIPTRLRIQNQYWGASVFDRTYNAIRNYAQSHDAAALTLQDFSTSVFKIKDLVNQISSGGTQALLDRVQLVQMTKSIARAVIVDAENESYENSSRSVAGYDVLLSKVEARLVADTDTPATILFGTSPGGLSGKGEHELTNWYNFIKQYQMTYIAPKLLQVVEMVADDLGIDADAVTIKFNPLAQVDESEMVKNRNLQAQTDQIYITMGVSEPEEVAESRFGGEEYSYETEIDSSIPRALPNGSEDDIKEDSAAKARMDGGPGSGRHPEGGAKDKEKSSKETAKALKSTDKKVESAGHAYDKNPTISNERVLKQALKERASAHEAHVNQLSKELHAASPVHAAEARLKAAREKVEAAKERHAQIQSKNQQSKSGAPHDVKEGIKQGGTKLEKQTKSHEHAHKGEHMPNGGKHEVHSHSGHGGHHEVSLSEGLNEVVESFKEKSEKPVGP